MLNEEELCHEPGGRVVDSSNFEAPDVLRELLAQANISFDGDRPWDIQVGDPSVYRRILTQGSMGFGESYMDGLWDAQQMDELLRVYCVTTWMKN